MPRVVLPVSFVLALAVSLGVPLPVLAQDGNPASHGARVGETSEPRLGRSSTILAPGVIGTYGGGSSAELGVGLQLRLIHYPSRYSLRFGGFLQGEVQSDGSVRMVGGLANGLWIFGCELGLAYRTDTGRYASSLGLHIGKTIDLGPMSIGGRITIPLADVQPQNGEGRLVQGFEGAFVLTFQIPATLDGPDRRPFECSRSSHAMRGHGARALSSRSHSRPFVRASADERRVGSSQAAA